MRNKLILIVEDEAILAMSEKFQLEKYDYDILLANTGENALAMVMQYPGIDLILMDINLRKGIDGTQAAELILENHDIPILFLSSHSEREVVEKTEKITSYGYVLKNSSITVLDASIKMAFKLFEAKKSDQEKEIQLRKNEEKYRLISENTSDGIIHFSSKGQIDYVSPTYLRQLGYTEGEELGRDETNISKMIHPEDSAGIFQKINTAIQLRIPELTYSYRVIKKNGDYIWREDHAKFIYDDAGQYDGAYVICRDITQRRQIEAELRESQNRYQSMLNDTSNTVLKTALIASTELIGASADDAFNEKILDSIRTISGAAYAAFNIFDENGLDFTTVAIFGVHEKILKLTSILGFDPIHRKWKHDPIRAAQIVEKAITMFPSLHELTHHAISVPIIKIIEKAFNMGEVAIVKVNMANLPVGDFTLFFQKGRTLENRELVELYANQVGMFIVRKRHENKITKLLAEKELILKEVTHRIKNNLYTISSLLSLQAADMEDSLAKAALEDAGSRVQSMKLLYEKLYEAPDYTEISVKDYFPALVAEIIANFPNNTMIQMHTDMDDFKLTTKEIQPLGIIVNELLTNIMKYAFVGKNRGLVTVSLKLHNGLVSLVVGDNGNGMPENIDFGNSTGFGLQLVRAITEQLDGKIRIERSGGTKVVLEFDHHA